MPIPKYRYGAMAPDEWNCANIFDIQLAWLDDEVLAAVTSQKAFQ